MKNKRCRRGTLALLAIGIALILLASVIKPACKLMYNPTSSAPRGWYLLMPERDIVVGDFVFVQLPDSIARLAADRGYLPLSVPLLKRVAATHGHRVCIRFDMVAVDSVLVGYTLARDGTGRSLEHWTGCRALYEDEVFLLSPDNPSSFDGRYFGPISSAAILGKAIALWTW